MKYLFIFSHPDDETVACAGTIRQLVENGEEVIVVSVTDGGAGEVKPEAAGVLQEFGSVSALRKHELHQVSNFLGVTELRILDFQDGEITNSMVWGKLASTCIDLLEQIQPDFVITFDHSGWYFHLDHVGVSIAVTLAVQKSAFQPDVFLLSHFRVDGSKWKYIYSKTVPATHVVDVSHLTEMKLQAFDLHASQNLSEPRRQLQEEEKHFEYYQLAFATEKGKKLLKKHPLFKKISSHSSQK